MRVQILTSLDLSGIQINDDSIIAILLNTHSKLKWLKLYETGMGDRCADIFSTNETLEYLDMRSNSISDKGAMRLLSNNHIRKIQLQGNISISRQVSLILCELDPCKQVQLQFAAGIRAIAIPSLLNLCLFAVSKHHVSQRPKIGSDLEKRLVDSQKPRFYT